MVRKFQRIKTIQGVTSETEDNILDRLGSFEIPEEVSTHDTLQKSVSSCILDDLGRIEADISYIQKQRPDFQPPRQQNLLIDISGASNILSELGSIIKNCHVCNKDVLKHELINGICFECHNKQELVQEKDQLVSNQEFKFEPLLNRIRELESQVRELRSKLDSTPFANNQQIIIPSPSSSSSSSPPPPPPVPLTDLSSSSSPRKDIDFSKISLDELKSFTPQDLGALSLPQRNQFNIRLKELQDLEQMTPSQREEYLKQKEQEAMLASNLNEFKNALKNLEELGNPLFAKMREQAEESALSGHGTFGIFEKKKRYVPCYTCGETNELKDNDEFICQFCQAPLNER